MKTPRPYQLEAVAVTERKNLLLSDECGLGKTLTAIEAAKVLQAQVNKPVLIVCPKTIKLQWFNELISQGADIDFIYLLETTTIDWLKEDRNIVIAHYEAVVKHIDKLSAIFWSVVIVDEAHRIKNRKAQRTEAIKRLKAYRKLAMTGTPFDKNPADVWSILNWLEPDTFKSYWRFFNSHVNYSEINIRGQKIKQISKVRPCNDAASFARLLRQYSLKRTKLEVRPDLPERIDQYIDIKMNDDQAHHYYTLADSEEYHTLLAQDVEISMPIVLTRILRLIQATTDPTLLGVKSSSAKLDWVKDWVEDNEGESIIIFTRFKATAERLAKELDGFTLLVGGKTRPNIDSSVRRIVGTIASMGEGLDLPHIDNAIFIDVEWSSILMQQAIDRIHRINIETVKHLYFLRCLGTVDELVYEAVQNKWDTKQLIEEFLKGVVNA